MDVKFIFVTGGVTSSLGKGIISASLAKLLQARGYSVSIHNYMCMPSELMFFKGVTRKTYLKARQFVKDNTFKGTHFRKITRGNLVIS